MLLCPLTPASEILRDSLLRPATLPLLHLPQQFDAGCRVGRDQFLIDGEEALVNSEDGAPFLQLG